MLISTDYFDEHQHSGALSLELHLRCVVAALRVLTIFGSYNCAPFLTFDLLENLFTSLSIWALYTCVHPGRTLQNQIDNLNNEFLIVHATDLVSSITSDRDLTIQAVSKVAAGLSMKVRLLVCLVNPGCILRHTKITRIGRSTKTYANSLVRTISRSGKLPSQHAPLSRITQTDRI